MPSYARRVTFHDPIDEAREPRSLQEITSWIELEARTFARAMFQRISRDLRHVVADVPARQDPVGQEWFLPSDWDDTLEPTFCWRYMRELAALADDAAEAWGGIVVAQLAASYDGPDRAHRAPDTVP